MIKRLFIQNYALIDRMELTFDPQMNVITGETGAGKSIMLGGFSLILGKRANKESLRHQEEKMIVEAVFDISNYDLKNFFEENDLDYDPETVIRREITPSGKSRAFVNDTPVLLDTLEKLGKHLVDLHGQHSHLLLKDKNFIINLVDSYAGLENEIQSYRKSYEQYIRLRKTWEKTVEEKKRLEAEKDFRLFQLNELRMLNWDLDLEEAERQLKNYENLERIHEHLRQLNLILNREETGLHDQIREALRLINNLSELTQEDFPWTERMEEIAIDLREMETDLERLETRLAEMDETNRIALEEDYNRFQKLMLKHHVQTQEQLRQLWEKWEEEAAQFDRISMETGEMEKKLKILYEKLQIQAKDLSEKRKKIIPQLIREIEEILANLGMEHSRLQIKISKSETPGPYGIDQMELLLSPDKGKHFGPVAQIASGGEMSRLMLAVKSILSRHRRLPTIIFDEIDAGISGEIAKKTANLLKNMAKHMQVIVITHLPQTAAAGTKHFKVFKTEDQGQIVSRVKALSPEERIREIAEISEGKPPSESALEHARNLLKTFAK